jgi:hypothetical protein
MSEISCIIKITVYLDVVYIKADGANISEKITASIFRVNADSHAPHYKT